MKKIYFGNLEAKKGNIHIVKNRCKGCAFCVEYCPRDVLEISQEFNVKGYHPPRVVKEEECLYCQLCETICPEFSIFVTLKTRPAVEAPAVQTGTAGAGGKSS